MQRGVHARLLDQSTSVREAAVELVGKFILIRPDLIEQYYDMLSERILVSYTVNSKPTPPLMWVFFMSPPTVRSMNVVILCV